LILDRPRNQAYVDEVRRAGGRISLLRDGDVAGAISTAQEDTAADILLGIGGSPEAVIAAAALTCMGGEIQCRLWPRDDAEKAQAADAGLDVTQVLTTRDLIAPDNVFFAATGVTGGEFLRAVDFRGDQVVTHSVIMRSKTRSIRYMDAYHDLARLREISALTLD
jgi:fructose-1,6-bisphosphatase II